MGVIGSISIRDNATSVLKSVRNEQTALRKDAVDTRKELQRTWDKTYKAKLDTSSAVKTADGLTEKVKRFGKMVAVPTVDLRDIAAAKTEKVKNAITGVAKLVATPVIKLKDLTSRPISKVTSELKAIGGKVVSPIVKIKNATAPGIAEIKNDIADITKAVAIPVTVAAVTATTVVVGGAIGEGANLEQSIGGIETLFKDSADIVKKNAASAFRTAGLSANEYMSQVTSFSASLLNSLGGNTVKAAQVADMAMIDMADNANKFGTDMQSIQNAYQGFAKQNYTMLDNLKLGYGGTQEEMQRLLRDAQAITGVKYNMDNLSDVYNAIHVIQEKLGVTGTTAKEAGETFSGSFAAMKSAVKNVLGNMALGEDVTSSVEQAVESAETFLIKNAIPMVGRVIASIPQVVRTGVKSAAPKIKAAGGEFAKNLKDGMANNLPPSMSAAVNQLFSEFDNLRSSFAAVIPQLSVVGSGVTAIMQRIAGVSIPVLTSIVSAVQRAAPLIGDVISTSWSVISPIANIAISTFEILFAVVRKVFPGIQSVIETVWGVIKPMVEGIGTVIGKIAGGFGYVADAIGRSGKTGDSVGNNAKGDNNWRGGLTWVGEKGAELVDLPKGSRILPNKESVSLIKQRGEVIKERVSHIIQNTVVKDKNADTMLIANTLVSIDANLKLLLDKAKGENVRTESARSKKQNDASKRFAGSINVAIAKLADQIIVREDADIDEVANKVAKKVIEVVVNMD